ncbi:hypothetical protein L3X38_019027 [Prunus dulcis]|uniref:NB-ARC domain-containing protein n=1 Tax=Prunus dulcis TaxID=3755 RepID=A0AAD4WA41_PRUDU|nr:hypothetical protein L3X38_019027 [Prunus dulcis]
MAGDVAQFLQKKFLASLRDTEFELSDAVLISNLRAIKDIVIDIDTRRLKEDYCRRFIYVLLDLTDAFTPSARESSIRPDPEENLIHRRQRFEAEVVGFDEQLRKIGSFLLKSSPSSGAGFAAVGILGMAGPGKTTLVREFLSVWIVRDEFSPIIWLCLSNIIKENKQVEEEIEVSIVKCMLSKLDHDAVADGDGIIHEEEKIISIVIIIVDAQNGPANIESNLVMRCVESSEI